MNSLNPENYAILRRSQKERGYVLQDIGPGLSMDFLWFNLNPAKMLPDGPTWIRRKGRSSSRPASVRRFLCALDREGMVRSILLSLGDPQFGPISSGNRPWATIQKNRQERL